MVLEAGDPSYKLFHGAVWLDFDKGKAAALALDDALDVRREVLVAVGDAALRPEARGREKRDPREREGEGEERPRARRAGSDGHEGRQADEKSSAESRRGSREKVRPREGQQHGRDPAEAHRQCDCLTCPA